MKRSALLLIFTVLSIFFDHPDSYCQPIGNEWIDFSNIYYKITVSEDGIYRITYNDLTAGGFPIVSGDPTYFSLWRRGKQVSIKVAGEEDGTFNEGDFIEFFGQRNDGHMEKWMYHDTLGQSHPYLSLFTDTAAYFLTVSNQKGKRIQVLTSTDFSSPVACHLDISEKIFSSYYNPGRRSVSHPKPSWAVEGEGWASPYFTSSALDTKLTGIKHVVTTAGILPQIKLRLLGRYPLSHSVNINLSNAITGYAESGESVQFEGFKIYDWSKMFTGFSVFAGDTCLRIRLAEQSGSLVCLSRAELVFPAATTMQGRQSKTFTLSGAIAGNSLLMDNAPVGCLVYEITDPFNMKEITYVYNAGYIQMQRHAANTKIYVSSPLNIKKPHKVSRVNFRLLNPVEYNYVMIYHPELNMPVQASAHPVFDYAIYRSSAAGGGHDTLSLTMEAVWNQFSYGETNPLAIRNLARHLLKATTTKQRYLFLMGVGLQNDFENGRYARFDPSVANRKNFIPPMGSPPSDILFTQGLVPDSPYEPAFPTARLPASSSKNVNDYLQKVKQYESGFYSQLWRKNMILLSGGRTTKEIQQFDAYNKEKKTIAEGQYLGANAKLYAKATPANTEVFDIAGEINKGVGLVYTFGHTSPGYYDVNIGNASDPAFNYNNFGKYPFLYVNGCESGNSFFTYSIGEDWIITPNKGSIGVLAHADIGEASILSSYATDFFTTAYTDTSFLDKSISAIHKGTNKKFAYLGYNNAYRTAQTQQFILHGDPCIKLFNPKLTDYATIDGSVRLVSLNNKKISALSDSIGIIFKVQNFGKFSPDSFWVQVKRTLSDGSLIIYPAQRFPSVAIESEYIFKIIGRNTKAYGINNFELCINYDRVVPESDYTNNCGSILYQMPKNGVECLYPIEFGVVNQAQVKFKAQAGNLFVNRRDYVYEIDTSYLFDSPAKISGSVNSGAVVEFTADIFKNRIPSDSVVFFWRVKYATVKQDEDTTWGNSSFIYINRSREGWSQAHFAQFFQDHTQHIVRDTALRIWKFEPAIAKLEIRVAGGNSPVDDRCAFTRLKINGEDIIKQGDCNFFGCEGLYAVAFSNYTLAPYQVPLAGASTDCKFLANRFVNFDPVIRLQQYLERVPTGDYIALFNAGNNQYSSLSDTVRKLLTGFGAQKLKLLKDGWPYIFVGQKNGQAFMELLPDTTLPLAPNIQTLLGINVLKTSAYAGTITSTTIGPASEWGALFRKFVLENSNSDKWDMTIYGRSLTGNQSKIYQGVPEDGMDLTSLADANLYPYIQLETRLKDSLSLSPPQLRRWQVIYSGVPEGTLIFDPLVIDTSQYHLSDIIQGKKINLRFAFKNISTMMFPDSVAVRYTLQNNISGTRTIQTKIKAPLPDSTVFFSYEFETTSFTGINSFQVFVNPRLVAERSYDNNLFELPSFLVRGDQKNPVLDVAFDGQRIKNYQRVSPNVEIDAMIVDENKFLYKTDTIGIQLLIKGPCTEIDSCAYRYVGMNQPTARIFYPTPSNNNTFRVHWTPGNLIPGLYQLFFNGTDASGNKSGTKPYEVIFEVVNNCELIALQVFPVPSDQVCNFDIRILCPALIKDIDIQIYKWDGTLVKKLDYEELVSGSYGKNQLKYPWDLKDDTGNELVSGIYIYRITIKGNDASPSNLFYQKTGKISIQR